MLHCCCCYMHVVIMWLAANWVMMNPLQSDWTAIRVAVGGEKFT